MSNFGETFIQNVVKFYSSHRNFFQIIEISFKSSEVLVRLIFNMTFVLKCSWFRNNVSGKYVFSELKFGEYQINKLG